MPSTTQTTTLEPTTSQPPPSPPFHNTSPPPPPPKPRTPPLLSSLLTTTDKSLARLSTLLSHPPSTDALLATLTYTLDLLHALLSHLLSHHLIPTATKPASTPSPPTDHTAKLLAQGAAGSKALSILVSDFRIFVRLWGIVGLWAWARGMVLEGRSGRGEGGTRERIVRAVVWMQIAACVAFQVLENGAYLAGKGVLNGEGWGGEAGKRREGRWWVWSSRFWAVHVGLEILRLGVVAWRWEGKGEGGEMELRVLADGEKEGKLLEEERRVERWNWWRDLVSNVAYAPMTLHWSVEEGLLSDVGVAVFGLVAGGTLLVDSWCSTKI